MDYVAYEGAKLLVTSGLKMGLNALLPGSGSLIEFGLAAGCFCKGDVSGGALYIVSGIGDLYTLGLVGRIKDAMGTRAKESVIQLARETARSGSKEVSKKVGQQVGKEFAKGLIPSVVEEAWSKGTKMTLEKAIERTRLSAISSGGHKIAQTICEDWLEYSIEKGITAGLKRKSMETAFHFSKAAQQGAMAEFAKQSSKILLKDVTIASMKGSIRRDDW